MPDSAMELPPSALFPVSQPLAAAVERHLISGVLSLESTTDIDGAPVDPRELAPAALIAAGAMALLRELEPSNPEGQNPADAVAALFRRRGLQKRVVADLPHLTLPESYRRLHALSEEARHDSLRIASLRQGEEVTLEYGGKHPKNWTRLVVARNLSGNGWDRQSIVIREAQGTVIQANRKARLMPGMVVWLGYTSSSLFYEAFVKGISPSWSSHVMQNSKDKNKWTYLERKTDHRTTLRQIYYGRGTALPLFK